MMAAGKVKWTAIVMTCPNAEWSHTLQKELELRQSKGYIDKDVFLLTVEDPKTDVGSGGATINALLTVAEYISAQRGYNTLNPDVLQNSYILILHNGRNYAYDVCGRPFTTLPAKYAAPDHDGLICMIDILINMITDKIAVKSSPGIWVSSMDMLLTIPHDTEIPWEQHDVCAITVPSTPQYCRQHGVYKLDEKGFIDDIMFRESIQKMEVCERRDGTVPLVCGLVYFSAAVSEKLLAFFMKPPLDACTYFGVDSGEPPIMLSLFFDVMLSMCPGVNARDFKSGARSGSYGKQVAVGDITTMRKARTILWEDLHSYSIKACMIESGSCVYPYTIQEHKKYLLHNLTDDGLSDNTLVWNHQTHCHIQDSVSVDPSCLVINSVLEDKVKVGENSVVTHCHLQGEVIVGKESFISGLITDPENIGAIKFADSINIQCYNIYIPTLDKCVYVITTHGRFDTIHMPTWKSTSSFCNDPWLVMMNRTGIIKEDLWGQDVEEDDQQIYTARIFPVLHCHDKLGLQEILWLQGVVQDNLDRDILKRWRSSWRLSLQEIQELTDLKEEFESRRRLFYTVGQHDISHVLLKQKNVGFRPLYNSAIVEGYANYMLESLDTVSEISLSSVQAGVAARTLANIADVLGCMAGPKGGLRSGPAANTTWSKAFTLLEKGDIKAGVAALCKERGQWLDRPDKLIRAARHYEGAAQILIRHAVMTAKEFFKVEPCEPAAMGQWVMAECPARIDISGGWSDTPPITYEHGGAVTIVGLMIKGKRPIGAKTRRIQEPKLVLVLHGAMDKKEVVCQNLSDLEDFYHPTSPGALLKAAFVCAEVIDLQSSQSLKDQLITKYGGGFELHSWTNLPHGSGMGTSSILAGAVMASLLKAAGKSCDTQGLIHAVLYLEQLLTTGGGWQDQIGGLTGGVKLGRSAMKLPLFVEAVDLEVKQEYIQAFNDRLVLLYTGKTRLARNLLQDVVRNWYARNPQIVDTEDNLVTLANQCAQHFQNGDMAAIGSCMDKYWQMKKCMAPGCEPEAVTRLMTAIRPYTLGMCMAGAGGGGFMYALATHSTHQQIIKDIVSNIEDLDGLEVYDACIDQTGMTITFLDEQSEELDPSQQEMTCHMQADDYETKTVISNAETGAITSSVIKVNRGVTENDTKVETGGGDS